MHTRRSMRPRIMKLNNFFCAMLRRALFALAATTLVHGAPYVWNISSPEGHFSLCLGEQPSDKLRQSLLMCRELAYEFCVNSSLIGSVLKSDGVTTAHFSETASSPTVKNVERLAWLIDSALVVLYDTFSSHRAAQPDCVHEWRAWVCSRAFRRAKNSTAHPLPVCTETCNRVQRACDVDMNCDAETSKQSGCTDFYSDSGGELCRHSGAGATKLAARSVPVFKHRRGESPSLSPASSVRRRWDLTIAAFFCIAIKFYF